MSTQTKSKKTKGLTVTLTKPKKNKRLRIPEKCMRHRGVISEVEIREVNDDDRSAEFVAATENGVETWDGMEYLDMDGVDMKWFKKNPVLLNAHKRYDTLNVIGGKTKTHKEDRKLIVKTYFADTEVASEIYKLVKGGFVRMLSIGYAITVAERIEKGEKTKLGTKTIKGPAIIGRKWLLFEISTVPVGADPDALQRDFDGFDLYEAKELLKRLETFINKKESSMADERDKDFGEELLRSEDDETGDDAENETPGDEETTVEKPGEETPPAEETPGDETPPAEDAPPEDERKKGIYAITPRGLESVAHECILDNLSVEDSKKKLKDALEKSMKPVGTPDSEDVDKDRDKNDKATQTKGKDEDEVTERALEQTVFNK